MPDHFDRLENRTPAARESALFRDLRHVLAVSKPRVPGLRNQLKGIDVAGLASRADLSRIPILRRTDLVAAQRDLPPLGAYTAARLAALKQVCIGPGGEISIAGQARDWWGSGRALFAAGLRKGMLVLNCFSYDLTADGHMAAAGADAIGSPVVPAGGADLDRKVDAVRDLRPAFFCGRSDELKMLLDRAVDREVDTTCLKHALVTGTTRKGLRNEFSLRGIDVRHAFMSPDLGAVAFECGATDGMTVNEGLIVEIVDPRTKSAVSPGTPGEIVVTRINVDRPLVRFATGVWSAVCPNLSTCGRTNMRIAAPQDRTPDFIDTGERRIHISDIVEVTRPFPSVRRVSLVTRRLRDADEFHLRVETGDGATTLLDELSEKFRTVTRLCGRVELVEPGTLSDDDAVIIDERPLN